jgi:hypothetical protein
MIEVSSPTEDFSSSLCVQTGSGDHPASCTMGTRGPFPGGKARPGRDADHSPPSSAEVKKEQELYLLSPHAPPWRVAGSLYLFIILLSSHLHVNLRSDLVPSGYLTKTVYEFLISPMHAACSVYLILLDLTTVIIFGEECRLWSLSLALFSWFFLFPVS